MNKLHHIQAFTKVVETGGFSSAARALGLSRSAVSKYVRQLEEVVNARLLYRSTRQVSPTDAGQAYYKRIAPVLLELEAADRDVAALHEAPRGQLRVNAPVSFGAAVVGPIVADFMQKYNELRIELALNDRLVDPIEEGYHVAIRIGQTVDPRLTSRRIAGTRQILVASPDYVERHGAPTAPEELRTRRCLHCGYLAMGDRWRLEGPDGPQTVQVRAGLCSNNGEALRAAVLRGAGIALLPRFLVEAELRDGALQLILPSYRAAFQNVYLIFPPGRRLSTKARLFGDFLTDRLRGQTGCETDPVRPATDRNVGANNTIPLIGDSTRAGDGPLDAQGVGIVLDESADGEYPDPNRMGPELANNNDVAILKRFSRVDDAAAYNSQIGGDASSNVNREDG